MKKIMLNAYNQAEHWESLNERNVYLSYTSDGQENLLTHAHNSCELLLVEQGGANYTINNEVYCLGKHDLFIMGAMNPHIRTIREIPFVRYGLTLMPAYLGSFPIINEYLDIYNTHRQEEFAKLKNIEVDVFEQIKSIFLRLGEESTQIQGDNPDMMYALLLELTIILKRLLHYEKINLVGSAMQRLMLEIKNYIDAKYYESLKLDELSRRFYVQPNTISKNFSICFGVNIQNYINSVRITNATRILEKSNVSVTDLAAQVGYASINTFIRQFGNKIGVSPLQYQKKFLEYCAMFQTKYAHPAKPHTPTGSMPMADEIFMRAGANEKNDDF